MLGIVEQDAPCGVARGVSADLLCPLAAPFPPEDIEWRVQQAGEKDGRIWCMVIPYLTARAIMERLDAVVGPANWAPRYRRGPAGGTLCGLAIRVEGQWITKWDGAGASEVEPTKGTISNALKRAAVVWGMGRRQLYGVGTLWGRVHPDGRETGRLKGGQMFRWDPPALPDPGPRREPAPDRERRGPLAASSLRRAETTRSQKGRTGATLASEPEGFTLGVLGAARDSASSESGTAALALPGATLGPEDMSALASQPSRTEVAQLPTLLELDDALADLMAASAETGLRADSWVRERRAAIEGSEACAQNVIARLRRRAQDARAARRVA